MHVLNLIAKEVQETLGQTPEIDATEDDNLAYFVGMRDQIQKRFYESQDNPRHFEKVQWFAAYWNKYVPKMNGLPKIKGPGVTPEAAAWG